MQIDEWVVDEKKLATQTESWQATVFTDEFGIWLLLTCLLPGLKSHSISGMTLSLAMFFFADEASAWFDKYDFSQKKMYHIFFTLAPGG